MDEQKESESSWEEAEQVGPYQLHEQVPQDDYSGRVLYRAANTTSGTPALVLKPAARVEEKGVAPQTDLRVRFFSAAPFG